jgi:hypothetical protein
MIKLFDTCDVLQYCVPPKETITEPELELESEPEPQTDEWLMPDAPTKIKKSWRPWSRRARGTVRAVPAVYPEHLTQEMKRGT